MVAVTNESYPDPNGWDRHGIINDALYLVVRKWCIEVGKGGYSIDMVRNRKNILSENEYYINNVTKW